MADIDKGLPNTRSKIEIPSEEELQEVAVQDENVEELKGPVEVIPEEDGGATIDYDPGAINTPGTESHFDNLADILPEEAVRTNWKRNGSKLHGLQVIKKRMGKCLHNWIRSIRI